MSVLKHWCDFVVLYLNGNFHGSKNKKSQALLKFPACYRMNGLQKHVNLCFWWWHTNGVSRPLPKEKEPAASVLRDTFITGSDLLWLWRSLWKKHLSTEYFVFTMFSGLKNFMNGKLSHVQAKCHCMSL